METKDRQSGPLPAKSRMNLSKNTQKFKDQRQANGAPAGQAKDESKQEHPKNKDQRQRQANGAPAGQVRDES